jgi:hypothetical protein
MAHLFIKIYVHVFCESLYKTLDLVEGGFVPQLTNIHEGCWQFANAICHSRFRPRQYSLANGSRDDLWTVINYCISDYTRDKWSGII